MHCVLIDNTVEVITSLVTIMFHDVTLSLTTLLTPYPEDLSRAETGWEETVTNFVLYCVILCFGIM